MLPNYRDACKITQIMPRAYANDELNEVQLRF